MKTELTDERRSATILRNRERQKHLDRIKKQHEEQSRKARELREEKKRKERYRRDEARQDALKKEQDRKDEIKAQSLAKKQARFDKYMAWRKGEEAMLIAQIRRKNRIPDNMDVQYNWKKKTFRLTQKMEALPPETHPMDKEAIEACNEAAQSA